MNFNTVNRGLHSNITSAELLVPENPPPMLDVQPVVAPQNNEVRAELAAVEDLADHQSIEAEEEGAGESLSSPKPLKLDLDTLIALPSELQSKILGHMTMQSLDDLAPLIEVIAQEIQELRALEDAQRPADIISNLRQLAQLSLVNGNCTPQLSASIASLLETIDQEVPVLQASGVEEGPASKIAKLRALAHLAVENVGIDRLSLSNHKTYVQLMECAEKLSVIKGDALGDFQFKLVKEITIDSNQVDLLPRFFSSIRSVMIHFKYVRAVSNYCMHALGQLSNLTRLIFVHCKTLSDISALGQLSNLTKLELRGCETLSDISALGQLSNLTKLELHDCKQLRLKGCQKLSDISALGQLSNLKWLRLDDCLLLSDVVTLGQLSNLTDLILRGCKQLTDISALGQLSNLTKLDLHGCKKLSDIRPLRHLTHLQELDVMDCPLDDDSLGVIENLREKGVNVELQFEPHK